MRWLCCECYREGEGPVPDACPSCGKEGYWLLGEGVRNLRLEWEQILADFDRMEQEMAQ